MINFFEFVFHLIARRDPNLFDNIIFYSFVIYLLLKIIRPLLDAF